MRKNSIRLLILALITVFPLTAHGWTLNTWAKSAGGYMSSPNFSGNQTSVNGSVNKTYTATSPIDVTVFPNPGYSISILTRNGIILTLEDPTAPQTVQVAGPSNQSVTATFARTPLTLSATAGNNGIVNRASITPVYVGPQSPPKVFTFTPAAGYSVQSISVPGHTLNVDYSLTNAVNGTSLTLPASPNIAVKVNIVNVKSSTALSGLFAVVGANAGPVQTVQPGTATILDGRASTGATSFTWTQLSGPETVTLSGATTSTPSFTAPSTPGNYQFKLTINNGSSSATTTVYVTSDPASAATSQCQNCHSTVGVGIATQVFSDWAASPHNNSVAPVMCYGCHIGANTGGHPGPALSSLGNVCRNCHLDAQGNVTGHPFPIGTSTCVSCHNPHSTVATIPSASAAHYNNITTAGYPASYVTSRSICLDCHHDDPVNVTVRGEWAGSGHAATTAEPWKHYDFKTRTDGCVRCHTTTGFIAYSTAKVTAAWGVASDKTKEVLTCKGCHSDVAAGTVRAVTPNRPFADETGYTNRNVGISNICMDCHSGMNNGSSIQVKVGTANFTDLSFVAPHYLTAGGTLHGKSGYAFPGRTYADYSGNSHRKIGMANNNATGTDGPCVTCHMSAANKHAFKVVGTSSQSGAITAITTTVCTNCHNASLSAAALDARRVEFENALAILKIQLQDKGYSYSPNYPYFSSRNWGSGQAGANVMGAAFNYKLFAAEPGAYAHYPLYAKQLIVDSIDAVFNNGTVTGDIGPALNDLYGKGLITSDQRDSLNAYKNPDSSCNSCHGYPPATQPHPTSATTSPQNCSDCHNYTGPAEHTHNNGVLDLKITCNVCHPVLSSSHAVHVGNLPTLITAYSASDPYFSSNNTDAAGYRFGCAYCHPTANANHKNGTILLSGNGYAGTTKTNITCAAASCHSDGKGAFVTTPNWYTGFVGADRCSMCHAAVPTTGSHPAHMTNGIHDGSSGITYASTFSCVKCHASTVDSSKNINYPSHANGIVNVAFMDAPEVSKAQISPASFNAYSTIWTRTNGYKVDSSSADVSKQFLSVGSFAGGNCSNIACHNNNTTPAWGSGALSCVACHSNL